LHHVWVFEAEVDVDLVPEVVKGDVELVLVQPLDGDVDTLNTLLAEQKGPISFNTHRIELSGIQMSIIHHSGAMVSITRTSKHQRRVE